MQLANVTVRLGGSLLNTVAREGVTPAEVLILQHIHGADAVVDIRPTKTDKRRRQDAEFERLAQFYDGVEPGEFVSQPGEERKSIMSTLFPGAQRKLPTTFREIGIADAEPLAAPTPDPVDEPASDGADGGDTPAGE